MLTPQQNQIHQKALLISQNFKKTEIELIDILLLVRQSQVFLALGFPTLFEYATQSLSLSEANAYTYTKIARTSETIPEIKEEIKKGNLTVTNARRIAPFITPANKNELIHQATTLSSRALEKAMAEAHPEQVKESVRVISENRFSVKLSVSEEILTKLKRAQVLISNQTRKNSSLEEVLEKALDQFLERNDPVKKAERHAGRKEAEGDLQESPSASFHSDQLETKTEPLVARPKSVGGVVSMAKRVPIPGKIKHQVFLRDRGQCGFKTDHKDICGNSRFIEIHHKEPVSQGGTNALNNLLTLCKAHHGYIHN